MCLSRSIRLLPLAGALIAGCATTKAINPAPDPRMSQFEEQNRAIDQRENQCIGEVMGSKNRVGARPGAYDGMKLPGGEQGRKLLACKAEAKRKREELSARVPRDLCGQCAARTRRQYPYDDPHFETALTPKSSSLTA